jgi:hypothetical protein
MTSMRILQGCKIPIVTKQGIRTRGDAPARSCAEGAWIGHAFLPAFFATQGNLAADTPQWRLWEPLRFALGRYHWLWRDLYGRPRSLKPWEMNEPLWRSEALQPVTMPSLGVSIAEWERVCPAPGY